MMLQDIAPHRMSNQYDPTARPAAEDKVLVIRGRNVLAAEKDGELLLPCVADFKKDQDFIYLFSVDSERYFLCTGETEEAAPEGGYEFLELKYIREKGLAPKFRIFACYTGKHLADWYRDFKFCGRCGTAAEHSKTERAMTCPACGYTAYPRIMPAVIVGVKNKDRLLITRYRTGYNHSALIAGFTEIGETAEETVAREVMEEAGVRVKNITYYKTQPWGIAGDLLLGYFCDVDGDDSITMDTGELKYAEWVEREDIILQPDESSLTNEMMKGFKEGRL